MTRALFEPVLICIDCSEEPERGYEYIGDDLYCDWCAEQYRKGLAKDAAIEAAALADDEAYEAKEAA